MKWPQTVPYPPPLFIHIPLMMDELVPTKPVLATGNAMPVEMQNMLKPFRLEKVEWFMGQPFWAHYEHVKIRIKI